MNEDQAKVLELSKIYEKMKAELDTVREDLTLALSRLELNSYFQDPVTMAVLKVVKPKGVFCSFRDVDYHRTALEGERQGSLSKKEAQEKGFSV